MGYVLGRPLSRHYAITLCNVRLAQWHHGLATRFAPCLTLRNDIAWCQTCAMALRTRHSLYARARFAGNNLDRMLNLPQVDGDSALQVSPSTRGIPRLKTLKTETASLSAAVFFCIPSRASIWRLLWKFECDRSKKMSYFDFCDVAIRRF